jgi:transitional endoplasmic reticulum ATPase
VALRRYLSLEGENHLDSVLASTEQLQITMDDFLKALREVEPTATREFFTERSTVRWHHIGGLHKIKETLVSIVEWPSRYPDLFAKAKVMPPRGILFSGPSGTGKTLMARALAGETGLNFISISVPTLFSKWLGESEKALHQIFKKAKQSAPCILFFDEIDTLGVTRHVTSEGAAAVERVVSQFFNELDNLSELSQVIVLGATNRENVLDPALTRAGRLDYIIHFPVSDGPDRLEIFQVHLQDKPLGGDVDLADLVRLTEGMVASEIAFVCRTAAMLAISELVQKGERRQETFSMNAGHFQDAVRAVREREGTSGC